ncbi:MAG: dihydrofolate reductase family protein [Acidimicrobiales bacterium]
MAKLIYASNMSLDGCTEDAHGAFDWAPPDDDVFVFITELMGSAGTYLYGRRMYDTMAVWETEPALAAQSDLTRDFANAWQAADKVVYSTTLAAASTAKTRLERHFDADAVRDLKAAASRDLIVGGPHLAAQALKAGLVDEIQLFVWPVVLGGGNPALPTGTRVDLELLDERRFGNGVVHLRYRTL